MGWGRQGPQEWNSVLRPPPPCWVWNPSCRGGPRRGTGRPGGPCPATYPETWGRDQHSRDCAAVSGVCVCTHVHACAGLGWVGLQCSPPPSGTAVRGPRQPQTVPGSWTKHLRFLQRRDLQPPRIWRAPGDALSRPSGRKSRNINFSGICYSRRGRQRLCSLLVAQGL